jgi:hypothetical protein
MMATPRAPPSKAFNKYITSVFPLQGTSRTTTFVPDAGAGTRGVAGFDPAAPRTLWQT